MVLLTGGTKKRQSGDIARAQVFWADYRKRKEMEDAPHSKFQGNGKKAGWAVKTVDVSFIEPAGICQRVGPTDVLPFPGRAIGDQFILVARYLEQVTDGRRSSNVCCGNMKVRNRWKT